MMEAVDALPDGRSPSSGASSTVAWQDSLIVETAVIVESFFFFFGESNEPSCFVVGFF